MQASAQRGLLWAIGLSLLVHLAVLTIQVGGDSFGWRKPSAEAEPDSSTRFNARLVQRSPPDVPPAPKLESTQVAPDSRPVETPRNTTVTVTAPATMPRAEELDPPIPKAEAPTPPVERAVPVTPPAPKVEIKEPPPAPQPVPKEPELVTPKQAELKTPPPVVTPQPPVPTPTPPPPVPVVEAQPPKPEVKEAAPVPAAITPPPVAQPPQVAQPAAQPVAAPVQPTPAPAPVATPTPAVATPAPVAPVAAPTPKAAPQPAPVAATPVAPAAPAAPATTPAATPVLAGSAPSSISATLTASPAASASPASSAATSGAPAASGAASGSPPSSSAAGGRTGAVVSLPAPRTGDGTVATPPSAGSERAPGLPAGNIDGFDPYKSRTNVARDVARDLNNQRGRAPPSVAPSLTADQRFRRAVADAFLPPCPQSADIVLPKAAVPSPQAPVIVNQPIEARQKEGCRGESR